jgi:ribose-phosphate pyrophosphokinase
LIVDDICDGGGTFIGLAAELKNKNAGKLYLAVSHGIFSKGFDSLKCFDKIFTTNSFKDFDNEVITQINLQDGLLS